MIYTNDKLCEKKKKLDRAIFLYAYVFLLLPIIIFFMSWTKIYIGLFVSLFALTGFYFILKAKRTYKDIFIKDYKKKLLITLTVAFVWTLLSGQGGLFFQNIDYNMRNAIFSDLIKFDWPVIFKIAADIAQGLTEGSTVYENAVFYAGKDVSIVYYLGFWLPPALVGKVFFNVFGSSAGLIMGNMMLFLWTFSGVFTVLYLFIRALKRFSYKIILVFVFFSGMDIIMSMFFYMVGLEGMLMPEGRMIPHLDSWTMQQYTSNTSSLFWVFNQAVPLWLFCCILLNEEDLKHIFLPFSCLALKSTLPMIGVLPIILFFIINRFKSRLKAEGQEMTIKNALNELKRYINLTNISAIPVLVLSYLYIASSPNSASFSFMTGSPDAIKLLIIIGSLIFETGLIIFILFQSKLKDKKSLLIVLSLLLFIIPFFNVGARYDFTMRASLPALFFLCYLCCYTLLTTSRKQIVRLLSIVLIIGSFTATAEILQPVVYVFTGQNPRAEGIESLSDITSVKFDPKNCIGTMDSFFMKYIIKR